MRKANRTSPKALVCAGCVLLAAFYAHGQRLKAQKGLEGSVTWRIERTEKIGGHTTTVFGDPKVIKAPGGKAVLFRRPCGR